ncbi:MAG: LysR family transcriptional regulator [Lachnospiraceae bacterium]|nr:LysR family transcriptional regulator [Lachnospiraceae bacterium]
METNSLHYFAEAAKDLNFTKTAKRLFISQQNLSNHIARLEEYYEVQLFERKPRLALTYAGEVVLTYANSIKMQEDNVKNILTDIKEKEKGTLKIGCSPIRTSIAMPILAETFAGKYPNIELHFYHHHSDQLTEMMLTGDLDFTISVDKIRHPNLITTPLFTDTLYMMVSAELLQQYFGADTEALIEKSRSGIYLKDFVSLPFVNVRSSAIFEDCFTCSGLQPNFIITTTYPQFFLPNFYEKIAASIVTRTIYLHIRGHLPANILFFPIIKSSAMPLHDISFIRHRKKYLTQYGQYFLTLTEEYFRDLNEAWA